MACEVRRPHVMRKTGTGSCSSCLRPSAGLLHLRSLPVLDKPLVDVVCHEGGLPLPRQPPLLLRVDNVLEACSLHRHERTISDIVTKSGPSISELSKTQSKQQLKFDKYVK